MPIARREVNIGVIVKRCRLLRLLPPPEKPETKPNRRLEMLPADAKCGRAHKTSAAVAAEFVCERN